MDKKGTRTLILAAFGGISIYLAYTLYKALSVDSTDDDYIDNLGLNDDVDVDLLLLNADVQIDPQTGDVADGQLDPDIFDVPDILVNDNVDVFNDINLNNYQELLDNTNKVTIDLNTDENVVDAYGQTNFDYEGLINSEAGEIVQFKNQFIQVDIHNVNNFEFWFVISNIYCLNAPVGQLYAFNIYSATTMQPIAPITYNSDIIGYQFTDIGVVFVEIIIACEGYYGEQEEAIQLSFFLDVGNYTNMGGGFVVPDSTPIEAELVSNANQG